MPLAVPFGTPESRASVCMPLATAPESALAELVRLAPDAHRDDEQLPAVRRRLDRHAPRHRDGVVPGGRGRGRADLRLVRDARRECRAVAPRDRGGREHVGRHAEDGVAGRVHRRRDVVGRDQRERGHRRRGRAHRGRGQRRSAGRHVERSSGQEDRGGRGGAGRPCLRLAENDLDQSVVPADQRAVRVRREPLVDHHRPPDDRGDVAVGSVRRRGASSQQHRNADSTGERQRENSVPPHA